jgi:hypothetical protein
LIGIGGTVYISKNKRALTSQNEYQAVQWIRHHTTDNSFFITQGANAPMITYFAQRQFIPITKDFFTNPTVKNITGLTPEEKINNQLKNIYTFTINNPPRDNSSLNHLLFEIKSAKKIIDQLERKKRKNPKLNAKGVTAVYALYSMDKFKGLYAQREWWLQANYYQAPIDNITKKYPLVYNRNGVYIWKIK